MSCVVDASATLKWLFEDERSAKSEALLDQVVESGASVPGLWRLEVANSLLVAFRRGRTSAAFRDQALQRLQRIPISVDMETDTRAWSNTLPLAEQTGLSVYDASYLELAIRLRLPLASADHKLCEAAERAGVPLIATK